MLDITNLNDDNHFLFAAKHFSNRYLTETDFEETINLTKFIKKIFTRYSNSGKINERLALNHFICFFNSFDDAYAAIRLLFFHLPPDQYSYLITFLTFLNRLPDKIDAIHGITIFPKYISIDKELLRRLQYA